MYELGRKKLLRKCENKQMPTTVVNLTVTGDRVFAGDQMESCHCFKYRRMENQLVEFADDQVKDWGYILYLLSNIRECRHILAREFVLYCHISNIHHTPHWADLCRCLAS